MGKTFQYTRSDDNGFVISNTHRTFSFQDETKRMHCRLETSNHVLCETDATKRALTTFGNSFGLSLYAGSSDLGGRKSAPAVETTNGKTAANEPLSHINGTGAHSPTKGPFEPHPPTESLLKSVSSSASTESDKRQPNDKSLLAIPELKRLRDKDQPRFVATHPCLVCGQQPIEAHHLKFSQPSTLGRKVSDAFTVPLRALHHRDLHTTGNELAW